MYTDDLSFVIGNGDLLNDMLSSRETLKPFSREAVAFLTEWALKIRELPREDMTPALAAFAFWLRPASLKQMESAYPDASGLTGLGVCLQFVPSNIPALFAYSLASAILAGCSAIVRLSERAGGETDAFLSTLKAAIDDNPEWKKRVIIIRYGHDKEITDRLSAESGVRVIWGGDRAVSEILESPSNGRDIVFPNRRSMAVIGAKELLSAESMDDIARNFYNDTYLTDQNACTSPGIICWKGNAADIAEAKKRFWSAESAFLDGRYEIAPDMAVLKLEQAMVMAACGLSADTTFGAETADNRIVRVHALKPDPALWDYTEPCGFFIELDINDAAEIAPLLTDICQTVSYFGIPEGELADICADTRTAPMGRTLDFSLKWDGHDLIREMCAGDSL